MLEPRVLKLLLVLLAAAGAMALPGLIWPAWLDSPAGVVVLAPFFLAYLLHAAGVPGLIENAGLCGWGWCAPTALGWAVSALICVLVMWALAAVLVHAWMRAKGR
jgi:glycine/D-amino acid oxidase-like deaminating enzyme